MGWTVLVPMKALPGAKTRLAAAVPDPDALARLVAAMRADTLAAVHAASGVARVVAVVDTPATAAAAGHVDEVFVQPAPGLNAGLAAAADWAAHRWPADGVAALVADLPSLRPADLAAALADAVAHPRSFVADADGSGTTALLATPGTALAPAFGDGSAARHAASATPLDAGAGLRRDVDTGADLQAACALGVGRRTGAVLPAAVC